MRGEPRHSEVGFEICDPENPNPRFLDCLTNPDGREAIFSFSWFPQVYIRVLLPDESGRKGDPDPIIEFALGNEPGGVHLNEKL